MSARDDLADQYFHPAIGKCTRAEYDSYANNAKLAEYQYQTESLKRLGGSPPAAQPITQPEPNKVLLLLGEDE
jgi:hypothetical protein